MSVLTCPDLGQGSATLVFFVYAFLEMTGIKSSRPSPATETLFVRLSICLCCASASTSRCGHLHDRCQSLTLGPSTLRPAHLRGNYSPGASALSHILSLHNLPPKRLPTSLSSSSFFFFSSFQQRNPNITGPRGLRPTSAAIT